MTVPAKGQANTRARTYAMPGGVARCAPPPAIVQLLDFPIVNLVTERDLLNFDMALTTNRLITSALVIGHDAVLYGSQVAVVGATGAALRYA